MIESSIAVAESKQARACIEHETPSNLRQKVSILYDDRVCSKYSGSTRVGYWGFQAMYTLLSRLVDAPYRGRVQN